MKTETGCNIGLFDVAVFDKDTKEQVSKTFLRNQYCGSLFPQHLQGYQSGWKVAKHHKEMMESYYQKGILPKRELQIKAVA